MPDQANQPVKILAVALVAIGILMRLVPHAPNFAPIGAIALFGAVYLPKQYGVIVPLAAMFLSDLIIGFYGVSMIFVYSSFALIGLLGLWLRSHKSAPTVLAAAIGSSLIFFLVSNAGVWLDPKAGYDPGLRGLIDSYVAGLPFYRATLLSDVIYTAGFFGAYEAVKLLAHRYLPPETASRLS